MKRALFSALSALLLAGCSGEQTTGTAETRIGSGQMPQITRDKEGSLHLVYGWRDSILYASSRDGAGAFSAPVLVSVLPGLAASHTSGPQIAATAQGLLITACNRKGDIFSFLKMAPGGWQKTGKVNDKDTVAKENLMALGADGNGVFAAWLDLRDGHNKIFGARSTDGGKSWLKNVLVYASPDTTVCECCRPSVVVSGQKVFVTFRNWLNGNRDMHLIQSSDGGQTFGHAEKLGTGSWALNGCPMDGGGLAIDTNGNPQTVWRRKEKIYASEPGKQEEELGTGKSCTIESVNGKNVYAWVENGNVVLLQPQGVKKTLGRGQFPVLKAVNSEQVLCVWEREKEIHAKVLTL